MSAWILRAGHLALVAIVAALWETAARSGWIDAGVLPPLSRVLAEMAALMQDEHFRGDLSLTLAEILVAFAIVGPLGLLAGFVVGEHHGLHRVLAPPIHLLLAIPKSIFLPIFIFAFGIGFLQKVVFAVVLAFFIVALNGIAAAQSVPAGLVTAARSFGASRGAIYLRICLPAMEPLILEGMRMALIFSITGVLLAEMYGAPRGIGRLIFAWGEMNRMPELFAAVLLIVILTIVSNEGLRLFEDVRRARRRGF